jgi:hypothetical protein
MQRTAEAPSTAPPSQGRVCACCDARATDRIEVTVMGIPQQIDVCAYDAHLQGAHMTAVPRYAAQAQADGHP